jgi:uncharacterized protein YdbL (DUF1318 family)
MEMTMFGIEKLSSVMRAAALGCLVLTAGAGIAAMTPAYADVASSKAAVDAAKTQGIVGEQGDGYLGLVTGNASAAVKAAVAEINAGRAGVYSSAAAKSGTSPAAAGEAAAQVIFGKLPAGQYYKPLGGSWTKK